MAKEKSPFEDSFWGWTIRIIVSFSYAAGMMFTMFELSKFSLEVLFPPGFTSLVVCITLGFSGIILSILTFIFIGRFIKHNIFRAVGSLMMHTHLDGIETRSFKQRTFGVLIRSRLENHDRTLDLKDGFSLVFLPFGYTALIRNEKLLFIGRIKWKIEEDRHNYYTGVICVKRTILKGQFYMKYKIALLSYGRPQSGNWAEKFLTIITVDVNNSDYSVSESKGILYQNQSPYLKVRDNSICVCHPDDKKEVKI